MSAYTGVKIPSFYEQFYDKYHIEDIVENEFIILLDLGKIIQEIEYDVNIWNMHYDTEETYASIDVSGNSGVSVTDNNSTTDIISLESGNFTIEIDEEGKFLINNTIEWQFGDSDDPILTLTGYRGEIFPYMPESNINETLQFGTDIIESYNGTEQRIATRFSPDKSYSYKYYFTTSEYDTLEHLFLQQQTKLYIPLWVWSTRSSVDLPQVGDTKNILCDTIGRGMVAGDNILIWDSASNNEVVTIDAISDTDIDFVETLTGTYTKPYVIPIKQTIISAPKKTMFPLHKKGFYEFTYRIVEPKQIDTYSPTNRLNYIPLIYDCNFFDSNTQSNAILNGNQIIDFNTGKLSVKPFWTVPKEVKSFGWYKNTYATIYKLYELLHYLRGRQKIMYMPSFQADFILSEDLVINYRGRNTFSAVDNNNRDIFNSGRRNAFVIFYNSTRYVSEITAIKLIEEGVERISFDPEFVSVGGVTIPAGTPVSWLIPYRLESDTITLNWNFSHEVSIQTQVREVNND